VNTLGTHEPVQGLFETAAEVLGGLKKAFSDYEQKNELAWKGRGRDLRATSLAVLSLLSYIFAVLAEPAVNEDTGIGPPPALAPGQTPPLPQAGPLAEPRSQDQVGFPTILTEYVISPATPKPARIALGQKLFFEPRLSGNGTVACATCHDPERAFTDGRPVSVGIHGRVGQRNAPTVLNALYNKHQFWDGRVTTLEEQAALPITNPFEMGSASIGDAVGSPATGTIRPNLCRPSAEV
jgi:cytochrome c peroxidase